MRIENRIVLALDDLTGDRAVEVARSLAHGLDAVKVGYPLVLTEGLEVVSRISEVAPVICDFKVADIPAVSAMIVTRAVNAGASGVIVHGFVGHDSVREATIAARGADVFVVTEMSHPGALDYLRDRAEDMAAMARAAVIVGRSLYRAEDPLAALAALKRDLDEG
jgi:orotidine-5'-phosphate decarboxylase